MNPQISGIVLMYLLVVLLAVPLGRYIGKVFDYESTWLDTIFDPLDRLIFTLSGIDPRPAMTWQQSLVALLVDQWLVAGHFDARADQHERATAQSRRQPVHAARSGLQHHRQFRDQYQPATLFGRVGAVVPRSDDPDAVAVHQRGYGHGHCSGRVQSHERGPESFAGQLLQSACA